MTAHGVPEVPAMPDRISVVVLAAGRGTRMRSNIAKVLHPLGGAPLIAHVLDAARRLGATSVVTVLGPKMEDVAGEVEKVLPGAAVVVQDPPLGTGHALAAARGAVPDSGDVVVLFGDTPLIRHATLARLVARRREADAAVAVLGMAPADPHGYGRLRFDGDDLVEIVEERHADEALRREGLCNAGIMAFDAARLPALLDALPLREDRGEYYLTDVVEIANRSGWRCRAIEGAWEEGVGVNSQRQLAEAERLFQERRRAELLDAGVIMVAPETVHLALDTEIEPGAVIEPYVIFRCGVRVGAGALIHSFCHLERAEVEAGAEIGPFARLRPGASIGERAKVGNFVEVKNARLDEGAKANHLAYIGDATVGKASNIGAGTITCNYDGFGKYRTEIGSGVFVGSNTALVAPVRIGDGALVAAGSTINRDVPGDTLAVGRARQENRAGGASAIRERLRERRRRG
jgi:bifunctional UDP-N-acetylglucosamine pyrophosphorylase/glucosamine-1-phosphate N-acetyltransferase